MRLASIILALALVPYGVDGGLDAVQVSRFSVDFRTVPDSPGSLGVQCNFTLASACSVPRMVRKMISNMDGVQPENVHVQVGGQRSSFKLERFGRQGILGTYDVYYTVKVEAPSCQNVPVVINFTLPNTLWGTIEQGNYFTAEWLTWWARETNIQSFDAHFLCPPGYTPKSAESSSMYDQPQINTKHGRCSIDIDMPRGVSPRKKLNILLLPGFADLGAPEQRYPFGFFVASTLLPLMTICCCCCCARTIVWRSSCCPGSYDPHEQPTRLRDPYAAPIGNASRAHHRGRLAERHLDRDRDLHAARVGRFRHIRAEREQPNAPRTPSRWEQCMQCLGQRPRPVADIEQGVAIEVPAVIAQPNRRPRPPGTVIEPPERELREGEEACVICCVRPAAVQFMPCGHDGFCGSCAHQVERLNNGCPMCRAPINFSRPTPQTTNAASLNSVPDLTSEDDEEWDNELENKARRPAGDLEKPLSGSAANHTAPSQDSLGGPGEDQSEEMRADLNEGPVETSLEEDTVSGCPLGPLDEGLQQLPVGNDEQVARVPPAEAAAAVQAQEDAQDVVMPDVQAEQAHNCSS